MKEIKTEIKGCKIKIKGSKTEIKGCKIKINCKRIYVTNFSN